MAELHSLLTSNTDESLDVDGSLADIQAETRGRIQVKVGRHLLKKLRTPTPPKLRNYNPTNGSTKVAKDVYKDRHIRHSVVFVILELSNINIQLT